MEHSQFFRFLYILGAVNALFFSILIFKKKQRSSADIILGIWLIVLSLQLFLPFFYLNSEDSLYRFAGYEVIFLAFHPIFLYDYIQRITGIVQSPKKVIFNYIPAFICALFIVWSLNISIEVKKSFFHDFKLIPLKLFLAYFCTLCCFEIYIFLSFRNLRRHKRKVLQLYSYRDNIDLYWLWKLLLAFALIYSIVMTIAIYLYFTGNSLVLGDFIFYGLLVVFIFFLGYWGWQQGSIFSYTNDLPKNDIRNEKNEEEILISISQKGDCLKEIMEKDKLFLNQSLSLNDLANATNIPPHQLSKIIHRDFGLNFFEFVNQYRVDYFKNIVNDPKLSHYTILAIAYECGFNSKASFNRIIKEFTGKTPVEFKKK